MAAKKTETVAQEQVKQVIALKPIQRQKVITRIVGTSPLIQNKWSEKALRMMREKHAGKKTKDREVRKPMEECEAATYRTPDGQYGIPAMAIKSSLICAAHKDLGIEKTLVRKSLFIFCETVGDMILPMTCSEPVCREDCVTVGQGSADLRYRPMFTEWSVDVTWEIDAGLLRIDDLVNLIDRAGFGIGIGEWRPEKGGEFGRFRVDRVVEG